MWNILRYLLLWIFSIKFYYIFLGLRIIGYKYICSLNLTTFDAFIIYTVKKVLFLSLTIKFSGTWYTLGVSSFSLLMITLPLNLLSFDTLSFEKGIVLPYAEGENMATSELLLAVTSLFLVSLNISLWM